MKLSNAEKAFVDIEKLSGYCLNPSHARGKHKARLFASVLGLTSDNAEELKQTLLKAVHNHDAALSREDRYGKRYVIDFVMTTKKGHAKIRSTWIILNHEDFARLTICYLLKKRKQKNE